MKESPEPCLFCEIAAGRQAASVVSQDELTLAFLDLRQFHPGHTLVIPRAHIPDIREEPADHLLTSRYLHQIESHS